jgi:hypothetical protein
MANNDDWVRALVGAQALRSPGVSALFGTTLPIQPVKRKVYFAFRFKDIMRVNNVRQTGKIGSDEIRNARSFYDRSIWEQRSINDPESLKRLMREGVEHSSAVCVLVGSDTWQSRWVKYEIARAVIDKKGLLSVGINCLAHVGTQAADAPGFNPLWFIGVYKDPNKRCYLAERRYVPVSTFPVQHDWRWYRYDDYTDPVAWPPYLPTKSDYNVSALSEGTLHYEYVAEAGSKNLGAWIDFAAKQAGR